jgi:threonine 3-dehydrogenase
MLTVLITGVNGEIGHSLLETFANRPNVTIVAADLQPLVPALAPYVHHFVQGDISSPETVQQIEAFDIQQVFHLAALLSTGSEKNPAMAHHVNVNGTMGLMLMARRLAKKRGSPTTFLFPSTIAVYGFSSVEEKRSAGAVTELQHLLPTTMYGINKLYCEQLGGYMSDRYGQLTEESAEQLLDFRALRFPGLISATTVPTGGTSDYAPEMIHAAAQNRPYECFVRPDAQIPFMAMPDGVQALLQLASAPADVLRQRVFNIGAFSLDAETIASLVCKAFPNAQISYKPHQKRQAIVDSWCADVDDSAAREQWGWQPKFDAQSAFFEYLIPTIRSVYA